MYDDVSIRAQKSRYSLMLANAELQSQKEII